MIASLTALALCHAGMLAICVAMHRHYEQLTGQRTAPRAQRWQLRVLGACLLLSALGVCVRAWGGSAGAVLWLGMASAGALWVALGLAYAPRRNAWVAVTVGCLAAWLRLARCWGSASASAVRRCVRGRVLAWVGALARELGSAGDAFAHACAPTGHGGGGARAAARLHMVLPGRDARIGPCHSPFRLPLLRWPL